MTRRVLKTTDDIFEHCAKVLLPSGVEFCQTLEVGQVLDRNDLNCIRIVAEVAEAFAIERYGKPKYRVPAA